MLNDAWGRSLSILSVRRRLCELYYSEWSEFNAEDVFF